MPVNMHEISLPVFVKHLNGLAACMKKAQATYAEKKCDETTLLHYRFYPDMFSFAKQVQIATDHAGVNTGTLAPPSVFLNTTFTFCPILIVSRSVSTMFVIIFTPSSSVTYAMQ